MNLKSFVTSPAGDEPVRAGVVQVHGVAFSGTSLPKDWAPGKRNQPGSCYGALLAEFRKAAEAAPNSEIALKAQDYIKTLR